MPVERYDPDQPPATQEWLALTEDERLTLVLAHHSKSGTRLPNARLHAAIHVVIENQLALGEPAAVTVTLSRLQREGLSRHEAVHAIGTAVSELLLQLSTAPDADPNSATARYVEGLSRLSAQAVRTRDE
jgi:hypothetical protein